MLVYRCFLLGRDDNVESVTMLDADSDDAARIQAEQIREARSGFGVEVWQGGRRVYRSLSLPH